MSVNRGKQFEDIIREQFKKLKNVVTIRLYDVTTGYINQNNICDLIVGYGYFCYAFLMAKNKYAINRTGFKNFFFQ